MTGYRVLAVMLTTLAEWADDQLAVHWPPVWIAQQMIGLCRYAVQLARIADAGGQIDVPELQLPDAP